MRHARHAPYDDAVEAMSLKFSNAFFALIRLSLSLSPNRQNTVSNTEGWKLSNRVPLFLALGE